MIGRALAHYRITAAIGAGGMGQVYRATDTRLGRDVALKVLPEAMASSAEMLERFRREARAVAALNHPHIVTIHSVEEADGMHFLTMELIDGRSLDQLIPEGGLEAQQILEIATALSAALAVAHDRGIIHRDLKPANVMVTLDGAVKILDFGLAKIQETKLAEESAELPTELHTSVGVVMGTQPYMSPEQVQGHALDHRTDIFSLGVILYEMSTGRRPFLGHSTAALFASILRDTVPPITDMRADLQPDLVRLIRRCLEKDPRHRIQTARDIGNELRECARSPGAGASIERVRATPEERSGLGNADEGFWVAVLPFRFTGVDAEIATLAGGLTEEIVTGLSRFSYLRVIARSSTAQPSGAIDLRTPSREIGARYVMEGSLRRAGAQLRVTVQLVDASTGANLWAETYDRAFDASAIFALQDDLVARVVSTCADHFGVLARAISEAVRGRPLADLTPYQALMRGFGYHFRLSPAEHAEARAALEQAVEQAPNNADCWAMLAWICAHEHAHGFNPLPGSLDRALVAARRAVDLAPSNHLAHQAMAVVLFFRNEKAACLSHAERAITLNSLDGSNEAFFLLAFTGNWERGCALIRRAMDLNPHHPGWYRLILGLGEYRNANYRAAVEEVLRANLADSYWTGMVLVASYGQLGESEPARNALRGLLTQEKDFVRSCRELGGKWLEPELVEQLMDGLRKAGLDVPPVGGVDGACDPGTVR